MHHFGAGLQVAQDQHAANVRKARLGRIPHHERHQIVALRRNPQVALKVWRIEVRQHEDHRPPPADAAHKLQRSADICAAPLLQRLRPNRPEAAPPGRLRSGRNRRSSGAVTLEGEQRRDDAQRVPTTLLRRDVAAHLVVEDDQADAVLVLRRSQRDRHRDLRRHLLLSREPGSVLHARRDIDRDEHRELPLLDELLHMERAGSRRDIPVHEAHIVAQRVGLHLIEIHPAAAEHRVILAGELVFDNPSGDNLQPLDQVYGLSAEHRLRARRCGRAAPAAATRWCARPPPPRSSG